MKQFPRMAVLALGASLFAACSDDAATDNAAGSVDVTVSGERIALTGFDFPARGDAPAFLDGWELRFEHVYVALDAVHLSESPNLAPSDQLRTGKKVAEAKGPWLIDLAAGGPLTGLGQGSQAVALTTLSEQNLNGGAKLVADETYAFGFSLGKANASATRHTAGGSADDTLLAGMIERGETVLYVGSARFVGDSCRTAAGATETELPKEVHFQLGFDTATDFVNCQNPDLGGDGHGSPRGLALRSQGATAAQLTFHLEHPFWSSRTEDASLRFDAFALAAQAAGKGSASAPLTLADLHGVAYAPVRAGASTLNARSCTGNAPTTTELSYDPRGEAFEDLEAFVRYLQRSQGHLNGDGLCAVAGIEHDHDHDDHDHDH